MSLQGGQLWREGTDTCVFKPAVRCEGEIEREPNAVSRIVNVGESSRDVYVEERIRKAFPELVQANLVTVHTKSCTPDYDKEDLTYDKTFQPEYGRGCDKLDNLVYPGVNDAHVNMITPLRDETFYNFVRKNPAFKGVWRDMISGIVQAAISMVPDKGPWIIHTDCHLNNILTIPKGQFLQPDLSLADWGRTIVIENPNNITSVRKGVREWAESVEFLGVTKDMTDEEIDEQIADALGDYPQHPRMYTHGVSGVFREDKADQTYGINTLRGWLPFVLVRQVMMFCQPGDHRQLFEDLMIAIKGSTNQIEMGNVVYYYMYDRDEGDSAEDTYNYISSGGMYWPEKYYRGLTRKQNLQRKRSATRRTKMSFTDPKAYVPFKSDKGVKTRRSSYTERFHKKYPGVKSIPEIAKATGISKSILQEVYNRGMAAWRTGHRPGASQAAWSYARLHSFILKGKTYRTADADLARQTRRRKAE